MSADIVPPQHVALILTTQERFFRFNPRTDPSDVLLINGERPLGEARNLALDRYNVYMQRGVQNLYGRNLDDDDLEHPDRKHRQAVRLWRDMNAKLCFLRRVTLVCHCGFEVVSFARDGKHSAWDYWEPTIMWKGWAQHRYPHINQGEDTAMCKAWVQEYGQDTITTLDAPELYKYRYHGGNVCAADHWDRLFYLSLSGGHFPSACRATPKGDGLGLCSSS